MKIKLNKTNIDSFKVPDGTERENFYDSEIKGFFIQVFPSGSSTFYVSQKLNGRPIRVKLGCYPDISPELARKMALQTKSEIAQGINPNDKKRAIRNDITFGKMFEEYMERYSKKFKKSWKYDEREVQKFLSHWYNRKSSSISNQEVRRLHDKIRDENGLYQANRLLERIRAIYNKHIDEWGWKGENPTKGIKKFPEKSRDRFVRPDELPRFLQAVMDEEDDTLRDYFLLSLLTGARKGNMLKMRFVDIDFANRLWRIPETKNGESLNIALVDKALNILQERKAKYDSEFVFPSQLSKSGHLEDPKKAWNRILKRAEIEELRIHDIRRTLGSYQAITGASLQIIGKSLGHKSQKATEVYSKLDLDPVRASLNKATDAMFGIPEKDNI